MEQWVKEQEQQIEWAREAHDAGRHELAMVMMLGVIASALVKVVANLDDIGLYGINRVQS
jgi:hypothetical protein